MIAAGIRCTPHKVYYTIIEGNFQKHKFDFFFNRQSQPTVADSDLNLNCIELLGC